MPAPGECRSLPSLFELLRMRPEVDGCGANVAIEVASCAVRQRRRISITWDVGPHVEHPVGIEPNAAQLGRLATRPACLNAKRKKAASIATKRLSVVSLRRRQTRRKPGKS